MTPLDLEKAKRQLKYALGLSWGPYNPYPTFELIPALIAEVERLRQQIASGSSASYAVGDVIGESPKKGFASELSEWNDLTREVERLRVFAGLWREHMAALSDVHEHGKAKGEAWHLVAGKLIDAWGNITPDSRGDSGETKGVMEPHTYPKDTCKRCAELREQGFRSR